MVATKRRFNPNLQRVRVLIARQGDAGVRLHALPQGRQGPEGSLELGVLRDVVDEPELLAGLRAGPGLRGDLTQLRILHDLGQL